MSRIYLGLWAMGDSKGFHEEKDPRTAKNEIKDAWRSGIRAFDTAFSYNTDSLLYSALRELGVRTDETEIIEKIMPVPTLRKKAEASLRALHSEKVSHLLIHWPADAAMLFPSLREAEKLMDEGKAEHIGISNFPAELASMVRNDFDITMHERAYSPVWIRDEEKEKLPLTLYGIFGFGTLFHRDRPSDERGKLYMYSCPEEWNALNDEIERIASLHDTTKAAVLFSFAERRSDAIIVGTGCRDYLSSGFTLSDGEHASLMMKALALDAKAPSDNIFDHNWRNH